MPCFSYTPCCDGSLVLQDSSRPWSLHYRVVFWSQWKLVPFAEQRKVTHKQWNLMVWMSSWPQYPTYTLRLQLIDWLAANVKRTTVNDYLSDFSNLLLWVIHTRLWSIKTHASVSCGPRSQCATPSILSGRTIMWFSQICNFVMLVRNRTIFAVEPSVSHISNFN